MHSVFSTVRSLILCWFKANLVFRSRLNMSDCKY